MRAFPAMPGATGAGYVAGLFSLMPPGFLEAKNLKIQPQGKKEKLSLCPAAAFKAFAVFSHRFMCNL